MLMTTEVRKVIKMNNRTKMAFDRLEIHTLDDLCKTHPKRFLDISNAASFNVARTCRLLFVSNSFRLSGNVSPILGIFYS